MRMCGSLAIACEYLRVCAPRLIRNRDLLHLRIEQAQRYFSTASALERSEPTSENTIDNDDEAVGCDIHHRHYNRMCENTHVGTKFPARAQGLEVLQRRRQGRLAVSRIPQLEPLGGKREELYQQKLRS